MNSITRPLEFNCTAHRNTQRHPFSVWLILLIALLLATWTAQAAVQSARDLVEDTSERILTAIKAEQGKIGQDPARIYALVDEIVLPHFDFTAMARLALGKHWRGINADQRQRFTRAFRDLLVRTYATSLTEYSNQKLRYLPAQEQAQAQDTIVRTEVIQSGGPPIPINYRMRRTAGENWKVIDLSVEGVSLVTNYRTSFATEMRQGGIDKLISKIAAQARTKTP